MQLTLSALGSLYRASSTCQQPQRHSQNHSQNQTTKRNSGISRITHLRAAVPASETAIKSGLAREHHAWYSWYSETRSFMLDSASVNSISSMPSPVYQWR